MQFLLAEALRRCDSIFMALGGTEGGKGGIILDVDGGSIAVPDTDNGDLGSAGWNNAAPSSNRGNANVIGAHDVGTPGAIGLSAGGHDDSSTSTTDKVARASYAIRGIGKAWAQSVQPSLARAAAFGSPSLGRLGPTTRLAQPLCDNAALGAERGGDRRTKGGADDAISAVTTGKDWPVPKGGVAASVDGILAEGDHPSGVVPASTVGLDPLPRAGVTGERDDVLNFHLGEQVHLL
jgi:hypothetical protein